MKCTPPLAPLLTTSCCYCCLQIQRPGQATASVHLGSSSEGEQKERGRQSGLGWMAVNLGGGLLLRAKAVGVG